MCGCFCWFSFQRKGFSSTPAGAVFHNGDANHYRGAIGTKNYRYKSPPIQRTCPPPIQRTCPRRFNVEISAIHRSGEENPDLGDWRWRFLQPDPVRFFANPGVRVDGKHLLQGVPEPFAEMVHSVVLLPKL